MASIIMTGGTAGFGAEALRLIADGSDRPILVGARDASRLDPTLRSRVQTAPLDLADLETVHAFAERAADIAPIGTLVLNAGLSPRKLITTTDGFDRAFQVNYLSQFLLYQLLEPRLAPDALVIATSSGTHDPEEKTPTPPPKHADAKRLARPSTDPERDRLGMRAAARSYTASKLCNVLFVRELARRHPEMTALAFDPGLVPGTQLVREFPSFLANIVVRIASRSMPANRTSDIGSTARCLAALVLNHETSVPSGTRSGDYLAMRAGNAVNVEPSELARNPTVARELWSDSLELLGMNAAEAKAA